MDPRYAGEVEFLDSTHIRATGVALFQLMILLILKNMLFIGFGFFHSSFLVSIRKFLTGVY